MTADGAAADSSDGAGAGANALLGDAAPAGMNALAGVSCAAGHRVTAQRCICMQSVYLPQTPVRMAQSTVSSGLDLYARDAVQKCPGIILMHKVAASASDANGQTCKPMTFQNM